MHFESTRSENRLGAEKSSYHQVRIVEQSMNTRAKKCSNFAVPTMVLIVLIVFVESNDSFVEKSPWVEIEVEAVVALHTSIDRVLLVSGTRRHDPID
jgi:carbon starvation protein CstA